MTVRTPEGVLFYGFFSRLLKATDDGVAGMK
jgi:hypothetical protein